MSLNTLKDQIVFQKGKNPSYRDILTFYEKIMNELHKIRHNLHIGAPHTINEAKVLQMKEGFPLIDKKDFFIDIPASVQLFETICRLSKDTNENMEKTVAAIEAAVAINALNVRELVTHHYDASFARKASEDFAIEETVLNFLIQMSIKPSVIAQAEKLGAQVDLRNWTRGYCPLCGSLPDMSELKQEGQRYLRCSFCEFQWQGDRLKCPFCENSDHNKLHYFYAEGREAYRVDLCDNCNQYIKTVDSRKLAYEPNLDLEDITTQHLDILAVEKSYKKPVSSLWGM
jgi:FdhE protein